MREPGTVTPSLTFPDSEPIASVTLEPDAEPPVVSARVLLPSQPRRGLALVGLGMGLAIVGVAVAGVKLLGGSKPTPAAVSTKTALAPRGGPAGDRRRSSRSQRHPAPRRGGAGGRSHQADATATDRQGAGAAAAADATAREGQGRARNHRSYRRPAASGPAGRGPSRPPAARAASGTSATRRGRGRSPCRRRPRSATRRRRTTTPERGDPRPHYERGNALLFAGDSKGAIAAYREAIRAAPTDPSAFRGLGLAYEQQSEPVFAARALRRYLKLAPNAPDRDIVDATPGTPLPPVEAQVGRTRSRRAERGFAARSSSRGVRDPPRVPTKTAGRR